MAIARPTRQELLEQARSEIEARLPGADARLRRSILDVVARIHSAQTHALYGFLDYHTRQPFAQLADSEWLRRHAELYGVGELAPEYSRGDVTLTGTNGVIVPIETRLRRADGREYLTTSEVTISGGTATAPVISAEVGADADAVSGTVLTFTSPVAGVNATATVAVSGLTGGSDVETDESLRQRVLLRIQRPSGAGTTFDYQAQAKLYPGVTDVFVHSAQYGAGTVGIAPMFYDRVNPLPLAGDVTAIQALMTAATFKPLCATPTTYALTAQAVNFNLHISPDTSDVRAAVIAELQALFRREATPGGVLWLSHIHESISIAAGEIDHTLAAPAANPDLSGDLTKIHTVGTFTWT